MKVYIRSSSDLDRLIDLAYTSRDKAVLSRLSKDDSEDVRRRVLWNPNTSKTVRERLCKEFVNSNDPQLRDSVAYHTHDLYLIEKLFNDPVEYVRKTAQRRYDDVLREYLEI
jgi:hypothetical protein